MSFAPDVAWLSHSHRSQAQPNPTHKNFESLLISIRHFMTIHVRMFLIDVSTSCTPTLNSIAGPFRLLYPRHAQLSFFKLPIKSRQPLTDHMQAWVCNYEVVRPIRNRLSPYLRTFLRSFHNGLGHQNLKFHGRGYSSLVDSSGGWDTRGNITSPIAEYCCTP